MPKRATGGATVATGTPQFRVPTRAGFFVVDRGAEPPHPARTRTKSTKRRAAIDVIGLLGRPADRSPCEIGEPVRPSAVARGRRPNDPPNAEHARSVATAAARGRGARAARNRPTARAAPREHHVAPHRADLEADRRAPRVRARGPARRRPPRVVRRQLYREEGPPRCRPRRPSSRCTGRVVDGARRIGLADAT